MTEALPVEGGRIATGEITDLRRVGINPDFWYPVAVSASVRKEETFAVRFAGQRIALYRGASGAVYALEDRCAHRQVPLSMGVVEGEALRCCYHAWACRGNGRLSQIPYLPKGAALRRAQMENDLHPELYKHYHLRAVPEKYREQVDVRAFGTGERIVFLPYTREVFTQTQQWIEAHQLFDEVTGQAGYDEAVLA